MVTHLCETVRFTIGRNKLIAKSIVRRPEARAVDPVGPVGGGGGGGGGGDGDGGGDGGRRRSGRCHSN